MSDYQVIVYRDSSPISSVGLLDQAPIPTLDVRGNGFSEATVVQVNSKASPEFIVLSPSRLLAQVPTSEIGKRLSSLVVLSATSQQTRNSSIEFTASAGRFVAEGRVKLVQTFLKILLTTPGTDIFYPWLGGGLQSIIGVASTETSVRARASRSIRETMTQMTRIQATSTAPKAEKLASARLQTLTYSQANAELALKVSLTSQEGRTAEAGLSL